MPSEFIHDHKRPTLKEEVIDVDKRILSLLLRRYNLISHMRGKRGHLVPNEEKTLREAWQAEAMRFSADPRLSSDLFSLLQDLRFYAKPKDGESHETKTSGFTLAPSQKAVDISVTIPFSFWHTHAYLTLAAFSGQPLTLTHTLLNDHERALLRILTDLGGRLSTHDDTISLAGGRPCETKDISLHLGGHFDTFALLAGQYLVRPSRVRFTAEGSLKTAQISAISHFLPTLGARMSFVVPKSSSFPIRLECSGDLKEQIVLPDNIPASFVRGLLLALPFAEKKHSVNLTAHPERASILEECLPILEECGATVYESAEGIIESVPGDLRIPETPHLPCEKSIACSLFAFPLLLTGKVSLKGMFPSDSLSRDALAVLLDLGLSVQETKEAIPPLVSAEVRKMPHEAICQHLPGHLLKDSSLAPILAGILAAMALSGKKTTVPGDLETAGGEFFSLLGLQITEEGILKPEEEDERKQTLWNAPSPFWALALAIAACGRKQQVLKLGNPGIITELWPRFWGVYNALPLVTAKKPEEAGETQPRRRRVLTNVDAVIPRMPDEE
ncbi:MAG: hypothetical protein K5657_02640 [Desulfovibrio sp.]|nr:hypothetical protein [Desulfovibrio sp.]